MLSLSIRKLCTHSQSSYGVYTVQAHVWFKIFKFSREIMFFILTLSTICFRVHSPYSYLVYTLHIHVRFKIFKFSREFFFFHSYTLHTCFRIHSANSYSPCTCLVQNFQIFKGDNFSHTYNLHICFRVHSPYSYLVYTLQSHVRFKIFKFSREIIFSCLHSPPMFQGSLSIQLFGLHSPSTC